MIIYFTSSLPLLSFLLLSCIPITSSWNLEGLQAVGMTAMSGLSARTNSYVKRLLGNNDLSDIAQWNIEVMKKYPEIIDAYQNSYSFANGDGSCSAIELKGQNKGHLLSQTIEMYKKLNDSAYQIEGTDSLDNINDAERTALLFSHVAAMHQPMHYFEEGKIFEDNGYVRYKNINGNLVRSNLYDYWENSIVQQMVQRNPSAWNSGWTHVAQLGGAFNTDKEKFEHDPVASFHDWSQELAVLGCELRGTVANLKGEILEPQDIEKWNKLARQHILQAGSRVAIVFNALFKNKDVALRSSGSLRYFETAPKIRPKKAVQSWAHNFLINLSIIAVLVGLVFYVMKFYGDRKSYSPVPDTNADDKELSSKFS